MSSLHSNRAPVGGKSQQAQIDTEWATQLVSQQQHMALEAVRNQTNPR